MTTPSEQNSLEDRIRALEEENARLSAATATATPAKAKRGPWWRSALSALLIVIATILVPVSIVTTWARVELVDENAFVNTFAPLAQDPDVQDMIIDQATTAIDNQVDFSGLTDQVFDGIEELGLPEPAANALDLLRGPAAEGVQSLVNSAVASVVRSDAFANVWTFALRSAHKSMTTVATNDGGGILVLNSDGLGIALGPIIEQLKTTLTDAGVGVASMIPTIDTVIIIGEGDELIAFRTIYSLADAVGWWMPIVTLALFVGGILIAPRRSSAVIGTGVGIAIGGAVLAVGFAVGGIATSVLASQFDLSPSALGVIYGQMTSSMAETAVVFALLGVLIAIVGWVLGSSRSATATRTAVGGFNETIRATLAERGLNTGVFGATIGRYRVAVRFGVVVIAVLWLMAMRPLSFGDLILVILVMGLVGWILELLQVREGDVAPVVDAVVIVEESADQADDGEGAAVVDESAAK
ncbi:hypothetical protein GCM10009808_12070 [Microbacterium sediminicola]|uniref:Integral membrane protein n=1 Tax=Microbacterium sediminicola TaxID=415210 RepID=A0ABP4TZG5_9MICO